MSLAPPQAHFVPGFAHGHPTRARRRAGVVAAWLALAAATAGLLSSCARGKGPGAGGFSMPPTPVEIAEVRPQKVRDQFRALGSVESDAIVQVVSELNAKVLALPFQEGQAVADGALLARLDDSEIKAESERSDAQRDQARSNAQRAQSLAEQNLV